MPLPETILQFGSGRFLRAFADVFIDQANRQGQNVGRVVLVQSTGGERADALARQGGKYHVVIRGLENGQVVDRVEEVGCLSRALVAASHWGEVRDVARSPDLRFVLSNTTEAGYALDESDTPESAPPKSFPAKLLLRGALLGLAERWGLPPAFREWLAAGCVWVPTLVDRIVSGTPKDHPLLATDPMLIVAEPFAFWAMEDT